MFTRSLCPYPSHHALWAGQMQFSSFLFSSSCSLMGQFHDTDVQGLTIKLPWSQYGLQALEELFPELKTFHEVLLPKKLQ
jgi:hypothetical protein